MPRLELSGVRLVYPGRVPVTALAGVDLTIEQGELVAIEGPSGGGKSTLLNVLGLLDRPTDGTYRIDGAPARAGDARARSSTFAFVFQGFHLLDRRRVVDSVELGLLHRAVPGKERRRVALDALAAVGLEDRWDQVAGTLSGGEQQRVAIARALASGAGVLLADEPTGNLDRANGVAVLDALEGVNGRGVTVVLVTHDPGIAVRAPRRVRIVDGVVVHDDRRGVVVHHDDPPPPPGRPSRVRAVDTLRDVLASVASRPGRTAGLALAVAAAVGLSVATAGLTTAATAQVSATFDERENRYVAVTDPGEGEDLTHVVGWTRPGDDERATALASVAGVDAAVVLANRDQHGVSVSPTDPALRAAVYTASGDLLGATAATVDPGGGASLPVGEVLVGALLAERLGLGPLASAPALWIDGRAVAVAGVITDGGRVPELAAAIVAPSADGDRYGRVTRTEALVLTASGAAQQVAAQAPLVVDPTRVEELQVVAPIDPRDMRAAIEADVRTAMVVLTAVALLAAVLALGNAMVLAIGERRGELALRRAVGARGLHLANLVLGEASVIGALGGFVGLVAGIAAVLAVTIAKGWAPVFDLRLAPVAVLGGIVVGVLACLVAVAGAIRVQPARALRD